MSRTSYASFENAPELPIKVLRTSLDISFKNVPNFIKSFKNVPGVKLFAA
jgi:hypothetical protein